MINLYSANWQLENVETILFDKDGTFIDSHIYWGEIIKRRVRAVMDFYKIKQNTFDDLCLSLGYDCEKKCLIEKGPIALLSREVVINSLTEGLKKYGVEADFQITANIFKEVHTQFLPDIYNYVKLIDEAKELFIRLKEKDVTLAVVTSDTFSNTNAILKHLNLEKYFDLVIGRDNCTKAKTTGEPALIALEKLKAKPETTISVGDAPMDFEMAKNAGLKGTILVETGQISQNKLAKYSKYNVNNLREVKIK